MTAPERHQCCLQQFRQFREEQPARFQQWARAEASAVPADLQMAAKSEYDAHHEKLADAYVAPKPTHKKSDLSLCATLLSLFDFTASGSVSRLDWERGLSTLLLGGLMDDHDLWARLLEMYDPQGKGAVQLERVRDVLPIDPRISVLLQQLVHSVAGCRE